MKKTTNAKTTRNTTTTMRDAYANLLAELKAVTARRAEAKAKLEAALAAAYAEYREYCKTTYVEERKAAIAKFEALKRERKAKRAKKVAKKVTKKTTATKAKTAAKRAVTKTEVEAAQKRPMRKAAAKKAAKKNA